MNWTYNHFYLEESSPHTRLHQYHHTQHVHVLWRHNQRREGGGVSCCLLEVPETRGCQGRVRERCSDTDGSQWHHEWKWRKHYRKSSWRGIHDTWYRGGHSESLGTVPWLVCFRTRKEYVTHPYFLKKENFQPSFHLNFLVFIILKEAILTLDFFLLKCSIYSFLQSLEI